jgi:hypothetical protein
MTEPLKPNIVIQLIEVQAKLKAPKSEFNKFGNYKYRSAEDILEALKPILKEQQLAITISDEIVEIGGRVYVKANAEIMNTDGQKANSTAYAREQAEQKGMNEAQITGSASSYARKYALNGLFAIDDTKDPDSHDNTSYGQEVIAKAPNYKEMPATAKQKQAMFTLLNKLDIPKRILM